jgi:glycosyltransferase involved in cell wall biosynthesis
LRKKILINYVCEVNYPNSSAYGIHVLKMCDAFMSKNSKVNLIAPYLSINIPKLKKNYKIKNKINFFSMFRKKIRINFLIRILFSLKIIINKEIDVGNCLFISRSALFAIIASFFNKKIILELHHELSGMTKVLYYSLRKIGFLENLRYIFIHKNLIKTFKPIKNRFICLDDAVDTQDFKSAKLVKKINKTCVYVGSFHRGKGVELIFEIAKHLENINFHLYGDKKFLNKTVIFKNVKVFDYINYKDIPQILSKYEIALMPYGNWVSGRLKKINLVKSMSPLKMFDYLASSNIIIASDLNVYKHILKNNYNSILLNNSKINLWVKQIDEIFKSKNKFNHIKRNAKKTANNHTWIKRSKSIQEFAKKEFF